MPTGREQVRREVKDAILRILHHRMGPYGFRDATVEAGFDHDGDPVLFIEGRYDLSDKPVDPVVTMDLIGELRDVLDSLGDSRFPHVRHNFHDEQVIATARRRKRA